MRFLVCGWDGTSARRLGEAGLEHQVDVDAEDDTLLWEAARMAFRAGLNVMVLRFRGVPERTVLFVSDGGFR